MSLPGFTAEAACYRGGGGYRLSGRQGGAGAGTARVIPADCGDTAIDFFNRCNERCKRTTGLAKGPYSDCLSRCADVADGYWGTCDAATDIINKISNWFWVK